MAKLIATDGKLRTLDRTIVTDASGAPCCCGSPEYIYFEDCCDGDPVVKITRQQFEQYVRPITECDVGPGRTIKYRFVGLSECFIESYTQHNDPQIPLLSEEQVAGVRCVPYVDREDGGVPERCDSLPNDCPECTDPPDCCIRRYHDPECDQWVGSRHGDPQHGCEYGTRARIFKTYQRTRTEENWIVRRGTRNQTWPPYNFCPGDCDPERLVRFERETISYRYDGECKQCYRDTEPPGGASGFSYETHERSRYGFVREYCESAWGTLPDGRDCTQPPQTCDSFVETPFEENTRTEGPGPVCDFSGPMRGPYPGICDPIRPYTRTYIGNCIWIETWHSVVYSWTCMGAEKVESYREEWRHAYEDPNAPGNLCWPPHTLGPDFTDQSCPDAVGKLIRRIQYSSTHRINITVMDRTADYGTCPEERRVFVPSRGRRTTIAPTALDML